MITKKGSTEIIKKVAKSMGYSTKYLSTHGVPKRLMISNGKKMCIVNASLFGFYPEIQRWHQHLFDSKIQTQEVVRTLGYKIIPSTVVQHKAHASATALLSYAAKQVKKYPVIIKPEKGFQGHNISIIESERALKRELKTHYTNKNNVLVQKILHHDEYRILIVNGEVEIIHIKQLHCVTGDGKKTLSSLLAEKKAKEKDELFIAKELKDRSLTLKSVLPEGTTFPYHLTRFSSPDEYYQSKDFPKKAVAWAKKLAKKISAPTIGIDIFAPKGLSDPDSFIIIELNANPAFDYIAKRYKDPKAMERIVSNTLKHYFKK